MYSESTERPRWSGTREIGAKSVAYKKSHGESTRAKSEDSRSREHRASEKHSSSKPYTSTSTKSSSSQIPEAPAKEQGPRRYPSDEPGKKKAEAEVKMKRKRRGLKEEDYSVTKRRAIKEQADVGGQERRELAERRHGKPNEERVTEHKQSHYEKGLSQKSPKESKHPASVKFIDHSSSRKASSSAPLLPISFKIPKKSKVVQVQTSTSWEDVSKSLITTRKSSPKTIDSPSLKVTPDHTRPMPIKVPSPVPSGSPSVQLAHSSRTKETSAPNSSKALAQLVSHDIFCVHQTEQITCSTFSQILFSICLAIPSMEGGMF